MKLKYSVLTSIAAMAAAVASVSCTDTWDDHYSVNGTVPTATLWESMQNDESLRPFMRVLDSCGYKSMLDSRQTFTVWAPVITDQEAQDWIDRYKADRANSDVPEDENTTVVQFIQNHIAMYTRPISSLTEDESIRMLNGKRMQLSSSKFNDEVNLVGQGVASSNGMLYKVDAPVAFVPNIWERIRANVGGDEGLDSLVAFFRSWQHEELDEEASVPGGIVDGQTVYLVSHYRGDEKLSDTVIAETTINAYFFCNKEQLHEYLNVYIGKYRCKYDILLWQKSNALPTYSNKYLSDKEYILYFHKGKGRNFPKSYNDAKTIFTLPINSVEQKKYSFPTVKPLTIVDTLIRNSSDEGETVFDPFLGSGTTAVAALLNNRSFIGCEINETVYNAAIGRIETECLLRLMV